MSTFLNYPDRPLHNVLLNAYNLLINTHTACNDFLELYEEMCNRSQGNGVVNGREIDLLRAALMFSSSGLDSFIKQLVRDSLFEVVQVSIGAEQRLKSFIEKQLIRNDSSSTKLLSDALLSKDPRRHFINCLIYELTDKSLQSKEELLNIASYFDVPSQDIVDNFTYLKDVFQIRNQIAHEMDFDHETNKRRVRDKESMVNAINYLFIVAKKLLICIDNKLGVGP